jgi:hypothetical protein
MMKLFYSFFWRIFIFTEAENLTLDDERVTVFAPVLVYDSLPGEDSILIKLEFPVRIPLFVKSDFRCVPFDCATVAAEISV